MQTRLFGSTDIAVSPLGLGTVKLGRDQGVKYPQAFTIPDDHAASELINLAKDLGINLIDTAPAYGNSEQRLGPLLKGQRNDWVICSKVGEEFDNGESRFDFSSKHTRYSIERSLKRLNTDWIDIVLVHSDGNDEDIIQHCDALAELEKLKDQGLIRAFGVSTKTVKGGLLAAQKTDAVMATYNLSYQDEQPVIDYCHSQQKGLLIKKAFASGHICKEGEDPVQKSMDFIFSQPGVSSAIVGTINPQHLIANVAAVNKVLGD
ncbi:aldo/keto reductase [Dasania sp. GY-MA-18]|uniref:Aldo/keto reductase n=1 Tax=Dasania phycosphaerae TaxID=2950436 RepID=A0A9J6RJM8_9GAMM|nr:MULTISPECIES: aldo/keto reductase [Dasania]MCR8922458.1 aldo/keto reductase [Dasania sp. GY-MA-18]MCZ0864886.1 aldo/keto reductase [Dasania phycosphaerae]MCZ0868614.1 aldo/keto reductase [Dasania phycosphaerae]